MKMAVGKGIPLITVIHHTKDGGHTETKEPLYMLRSRQEEQEFQERNKDSLGFWYGTWCDKCCGCYPKFYTEQGFDNNGYYVCMVCGKESKHEPLPWIARDDWNSGQYAFVPGDYQYTIFDFKEDT
jgi:hypothetical protein